jgi:cytosine/adenosine deaminase-related metal-dependent hydrolase
MPQTRLLIRNGCVIDTEPAVVARKNIDVLIEGQHIVRVDPNIPPGDATVVDASGMIVLPGFVDTHRHLWQTQLRGAEPDSTLTEYMVRLFSTLGPRYRPDDVYVGNLLGAADCLDAGITTLLDWSHVQNSPEHSDAAVAALRDAGGRAVFGYGYPNTDLTAWMFESSLPCPEDVRRVKDTYFTSDDQLVTMALAARGPEYSSMEVVQHDWRLARELGCRISVHVGGAELAAKYRPIQQLAQHSLLGADTTYIHCSTLTDNDLEAIKHSDASVSSASMVEAQMGHGQPVVARALSSGIEVSLSGDVVTSGVGDMFNQMRATYLLCRAQQTAEALAAGVEFGSTRPGTPSERHRTLVTTSDVLRMATMGGASALGMADRIGSLSGGKQADVVLLRTDRLHTRPLHDPIGAVVMQAERSDVDTVVVAGRVVKRNGVLVGLDVPTLLDRAESSAAWLYRAAGVTGR